MAIPGRNILVYIEKDGVYYPTACDKNCSLNMESEFLEITDPGGDNTRRRIPTITDWSVSGDCLVDYHKLISVLYMQQSILAGTRIQIKFYAQNGDGYAIYQGYGYFQSVSETGDVAGAAAYTYNIVADGGLTITSNIPVEPGGQLLKIMGTDSGEAVETNDNKLIQTN